MNYAKTLPVTDDGDIKIDEQERVSLIGGVEGVIQELKILLTTVQGEDVFEDEHGLRVFEVAGASDSVLEREITFALRDDDRVESVENVEVVRREGDDRDRTRIANISLTLTEASEIINFGVDFDE